MGEVAVDEDEDKFAWQRCGGRTFQAQVGRSAVQVQGPGAWEYEGHSKRSSAHFLGPPRQPLQP